MIKMKLLLLGIILTSGIHLLIGCTASNRSMATQDERLAMEMKKPADAINLTLLKDQDAPSLAMRGSARGLPVAGLAGSLISIASDAVKKIIADDQKKYTAAYQFGLNDLYFYDQLSGEGPFDPVGMQFSGFTMVRTFKNVNGQMDTAFIADFELDTSNVYEIINNSIFRLKLKSFQLKYAKAKLSGENSNKLNMDMEISFVTSYAGEQGMLYDNVTVGKFFLLLRDAPLDPAARGYSEYYKNLAGKKLVGRSFLVPRSLGYRKENGGPVKSFSQGLYSINVKVKECSKQSFVSKILIDNSAGIIDVTRDWMKKDVKARLPASMQ